MHNDDNNNNKDVDYDNSEWRDMARPHKKYSLYYELKERMLMMMMMMIIILNNTNFIS